MIPMRPISCFTLACLMAMLTACANMGQSSPNAQTIGAEQLPISHRPIAAISPTWWTQWQDNTLNHLIDLTLQQSPDMAAAQARLRQAQAAKGMAQSQTGPQIGASATGVGVYHDSLNDRVPPVVDNLIQNDVIYGNAQLNAQWQWDLWGKYKAQIAAALGRENATAYEMAQTRLLLAQAVNQTYIQWQILIEQKKLLKQRIQIKKQQENIILARVKAGLLPASQVYPIQAAQRQLQAAIYQTDHTISQVRHALSALSGQAANALDNMQPEPLRAIPPLPQDELTADLLGKRPDIAAQREAVLMRNELIKAAKAEFYPNIRIRALTGLSEIKIGNLPTSATAMLGLLPSISLPIFTSGALQSNLAQKNAEFDEQVARYNQSVYRALREAADALSAYDHAIKAQQEQMQNITIAQKQAQAMQRRVNAGIEIKLQQLNYQDDILTTQTQALNTRLQLAQAWVNVNVAFGGGWKN